MKEADIPTPYYIVYAPRIEANADLIASVARRAGADIIMAFKANALWRTFDILRRRGTGFTASSLWELRLGREHLGRKAHSYALVYRDEDLDEWLAGSSHITFNSLGQWQRHRARVLEHGGASPGLRVNPQCSVVEQDIYNPSLPGSRFGVSADELADGLPEGIEGLHFHALCEGSATDLVRVLEAFESQYGHLLPHVKWVNMGGGHLMTRRGYDTDGLVTVLRAFRDRWPQVSVILEPGSAWMWRTGDLVASVLDIVEHQGVKTAIIDASFACHMPDTLEMPYLPAVTEARRGAPNHYRLGGNSCLSGDYKDGWDFDQPLRVGQRLRLEDMNHYTTVKTTMFNGLQHPSVVVCDADGECRYLRQYTYDDYKSRMN